MRLLARLFDPLFLRSPFEPAQARRYARQRPALGDFDSRLVQALAPRLAGARTVLDLGSGAGDFARVVMERHPHLVTITVDPGRAFRPRLRARAEALPLAAATIDVAVCLSSLRHVRDRVVALAELRRVVRPGGSALVVELDPDADATRRDRHASAMPSALARAAFRLGLAIAPPRRELADCARRAGWVETGSESDPLQPLALLWLS